MPTGSDGIEASEYGGHHRDNTLPAKKTSDTLTASEKLVLLRTTGSEDVTRSPDDSFIGGPFS